MFEIRLEVELKDNVVKCETIKMRFSVVLHCSTKWIGSANSFN